MVSWSYEEGKQEEQEEKLLGRRLQRSGTPVSNRLGER